MKCELLSAGRCFMLLETVRTSTGVGPPTPSAEVIEISAPLVFVAAGTAGAGHALLPNFLLLAFADFPRIFVGSLESATCITCWRRNNNASPT